MARTLVQTTRRGNILRRISAPTNVLPRQIHCGWLSRWHCGRLLGHRFLPLTHVGRRSLLPRHTVLEVMVRRPDAQQAVVMSACGRDADCHTGGFGT
jgi:hypothetical protein